MLHTKFQADWPFGSGGEAKNKFLDGRHGGNLRFPSGTIIAIFVLQVTLMLHTKFQINWLFGSGGEVKSKFSRWPPGHVGFPIRTILAFFDLQVSRCFLPSFKSIGLSVQEKKQKIDFEDGRYSFSDCNDLANFDTGHPDASHQISSEIAFRFRRKSEKQIFKMAAMATILDFRLNHLSYFWSAVTPMLPTKFQVNWPFGSGEEEKNRFSRWRPSSFFDWNNFSYFWSTSYPNTTHQVSSQPVQRFRTTDNRRSHKLTWSFAPGKLIINNYNKPNQ